MRTADIFLWLGSNLVH